MDGHECSQMDGRVDGIELARLTCRWMDRKIVRRTGRQAGKGLANRWVRGKNNGQETIEFFTSQHC